MPERELLSSGTEPPLLDPPAEEKLRSEIEALRRELEEERRKTKRDKKRNQSNQPRKRTLWLIGLALATVLVLAFIGGYLPHHLRESSLKKEAQAEEELLPVVTFFLATRSAPEAQLNLPGTMEALLEAPVLARATGYLKKRYADIGDHVRAGQLMAEIAAPDLDQQVEQARAQLLQARATVRQTQASLEQTRANQALAKVTADRWAGLLKRGAVSPQENDTQQANYEAQTANVASLEEAVRAAQQSEMASEANLNRLLELQSYEQVRAPFDGVVTLRNIDTGALINTGQTLLYRVSQGDVLRTYIFVPESGAPLVQVGQKATLTVEEYPGRQFVGRITRTADALDPATRTLLTEVQVPSNNGALRPGMFAEVLLDQQRQNPPILISSDALIVLPKGTFAAVLEGNAKPVEAPSTGAPGGSDGQGSGGQSQQSQSEASQSKDGKKKNEQKQNPEEAEEDRLREQQKLPTYTVHLVPVAVGRDYGAATEILTGLKPGDQVVQNPNESVQEGAKVKGELSRENPATSNNAQAQTQKSNSNSQVLAPAAGAEPTPKQPSKERMTRGAGR